MGHNVVLVRKIVTPPVAADRSDEWRRRFACALPRSFPEPARPLPLARRLMSGAGVMCRWWH